MITGMLRKLYDKIKKLIAHEELLFACCELEADDADHYNSDEGQPRQFVWLSKKEHADKVGARCGYAHPNGV